MNAPGSALRARVSAQEWQVRVDLAAAYQLASHFRWTDLIYTHFSARVPGTHDEFLINPYGLLFDEITASTLVRIDALGRVLEDATGLGYNQAGFVIHGAVHAARPEIQCVIHTHTRAGVAVSAMQCGLLPISQHALRVCADISYHDYEGIALDLDERTRLARDLGASRSMLLRNHGLLTLGDTIRDAFERMYYLECACQIQVDALAGGQVRLLPESVVQKGWQQFERADRPSAQKDWPALLRLLERRGSNFRD